MRLVTLKCYNNLKLNNERNKIPIYKEKIEELN